GFNKVGQRRGLFIGLRRDCSYCRLASQRVNIYHSILSIEVLDFSDVSINTMTRCYAFPSLPAQLGTKVRFADEFQDGSGEAVFISPANEPSIFAMFDKLGSSAGTR